MHMFLWYMLHPAPRPLASPACKDDARAAADDNNNNNNNAQIIYLSHRRNRASGPTRSLSGPARPSAMEPSSPFFPPRPLVIRYNERVLD